MTHLHKYNLSTLRKYPNAIRHIAWAIAILLAAYGLWYSITSARAGYKLVTEAESRIAKAEVDTQELIEVLNGRLAMIDTEDGAKYAVIERVTWEVVKCEILTYRASVDVGWLYGRK